MAADINDFFSLIHSTDSVDWLRVVRNEIDKRLAELGVSPAQAAAHAASPLTGVSNVPDAPAKPPAQVNVGPNQAPFKKDAARSAVNASKFAAAAELEQGKRQEMAANAPVPTLPADSQQHTPVATGYAEAAGAESKKKDEDKADKGKHAHK